MSGGSRWNRERRLEERCWVTEHYLVAVLLDRNGHDLTVECKVIQLAPVATPSRKHAALGCHWSSLIAWLRKRLHNDLTSAGLICRVFELVVVGGKPGVALQERLRLNECKRLPVTKHRFHPNVEVQAAKWTPDEYDVLAIC